MNVNGGIIAVFVDSVPSNCSIERELLTAFSPYLFPFVLEYSLIAVGIFAIMGSNLGKSSYISFLTTTVVV